MPVVREVTWSSAPVPPRCRRCAAQAESALQQGLEAALVDASDVKAQSDVDRSEQAILAGVWTDLRVWDWPCSHHRAEGIADGPTASAVYFACLYLSVFDIWMACVYRGHRLMIHCVQNCSPQ